MGAGSLWTGEARPRNWKRVIWCCPFAFPNKETIDSWPPWQRNERFLMSSEEKERFRKAIELLEYLGVLREISGKRRGRAYAYQEYLDALIGDDG